MRIDKPWNQHVTRALNSDPGPVLLPGIMGRQYINDATVSNCDRTIGDYGFDWLNWNTPAYRYQSVTIFHDVYSAAPGQIRPQKEPQL